MYLYMEGKTSGRGALVISLPVNSPGASGTTFSRNKSYNGGHWVLGAHLASALLQLERLEGKISHPAGVLWRAVPED